MAMTINTNIVSINSQRNLSLSGNSLGTTMQRLSSGLRVNSAKDDAAGLAIAERMNAQSRGLAVAARNANDGISLAQTTEGALGKVGDMLQRMRELAVQSSNATNSSADREALQAEVSQLRAEIDRVAKTTSFNGTKVLDGSFTGGVFQVGAGAGDNITVGATTKATADGLGNTTFGSSTSKALDASKITDLDKELSGVKLSANGQTIDLGTIGKASSGQERLGQIVSAINSHTADTGVTAFLEQDKSGAYTMTLKSDSDSAVTLVGLQSLEAAASVTIARTATYNTKLTDLTDAIAAYDPANATTAEANAGAVVNAAKGLAAVLEGYGTGAADSTGAAAALYKQIEGLEALNDGTSWVSSATADDFAKALASFSAKGATDAHDSAMNDALVKAEAKVHSLTGEESKATVDAAHDALVAARTAAGITDTLTQGKPGTQADVADAVKALQKEIDVLGLNVSRGGDEVKAHKGIADVNVGTQAGAWEAIKQIDSAIDQVNAARADLGALQTRFEKSIENIDIMNENITAARGRIVDADFATETANLSRAQILQQAGTAMVAQANQLPQQVLSLLQ